ncbi:hypothetical protein AB1Y20_022720 [Prymnesium parvum]|uniref:Mitochondrial splicing suppressor 51-like C-terminal domain-containing protein n=1 Tax=Prymnesium parvum TaxID=97485 RepID=A0AB34JKE3_PRYPA
MVADPSGLLSLRRSTSRTAWHFSDSPPSAPAPPAPPTTPPAPPLTFLDAPTPGRCIGTLRWRGASPFPPLPPYTSPTPPPLTGWREYAAHRLPPPPHSAPLLDGLSYPLTLAHAIGALRLSPPSPGPLHLLVVGASSTAEERLARDSNYWPELLHALPPHASLVLSFVGPEIEASYPPRPLVAGRLSARAYRGTLGELLRAEPHLTAANTLLVGFNTGMGSGLFPLMRSWLPDLLLVLSRRIVALFTCANDYSDLAGELLVWRTLLRARLALPPVENPFRAATVVREDSRAACEWSCSSCYYYAVCGAEEGARLPPAVDAKLEAALRQLAKKHKRTQVPSRVP